MGAPPWPCLLRTVAHTKLITSLNVGRRSLALITRRLTSLEMKDEFRCLIAALYGKTFANNETVVVGTATAPDVALRCAFYGNAELTSREMHKGRERDGAAFGFAVLFNDHVYRKPELRKLLEEEYLTGNRRAHYLRRCEQLHKRWRYFDPRPNADWLVLEGALPLAL